MFNIDYLLDLKKQISIFNLFVLMLFHNKVYFYDSMEINFAHQKPFVCQDIKYISVNNTIKWFNTMMSMQGQTAKNKNMNNLNLMTSIANINLLLHNKNNDIETEDKQNQIPIGDISISNINRFAYKNLEIKESINGFVKKTKSFNRMEDETRIDLFKFIYNLIGIKNYEMALYICDHYAQKYYETLFLNPLLYLILAEIYSEIISVELSEVFFNKSINLVNWMYGEDKSPLLIDIYYTYSNILLKYWKGKEEDNEKKNEYFIKIKSYLTKTVKLSQSLFGNMNEKELKPIAQLIILDLSVYLSSTNNIQEQEVLQYILKFEEIVNRLSCNSLFIEELAYINLFIDTIQSSKLSNEVYSENMIKLIIRSNQLKSQIENCN